MRTRISLLARAVPRIAVAYTMRSGALSPPGLALVSRCTSPLLLSPSEPASVVHARLLLGGTLLGVAPWPRIRRQSVRRVAANGRRLP